MNHLITWHLFHSEHFHICVIPPSIIIKRDIHILKNVLKNSPENVHTLHLSYIVVYTLSHKIKQYSDIPKAEMGDRLLNGWKLIISCWHELCLPACTECCITGQVERDKLLTNGSVTITEWGGKRDSLLDTGGNMNVRLIIVGMCSTHLGLLV
jgi:hypothetical protein